MKFPSAGTKTKMHPAAMPGDVSGSVTVTNRRTAFAPRSSAASPSSGPRRSSEA